MCKFVVRILASSETNKPTENDQVPREDSGESDERVIASSERLEVPFAFRVT